MDFRAASHDDIENYIMSKLVFEENAMSYILKGQIFVEGVLEHLLAENLPHPTAILGKGRLGYDQKVDLARALDLISPGHVSAFKAINKVRNLYAHQADYEVAIEQLGPFKLNWVPIQEKAFKVAGTKGPDECAKIATIFLCWSAIRLIKASK